MAKANVAKKSGKGKTSKAVKKAARSPSKKPAKPVLKKSRARSVAARAAPTTTTS